MLEINNKIKHYQILGSAKTNPNKILFLKFSSWLSFIKKKLMK